MKVRLHSTTEDLLQILDLQKRNHKDAISREQAVKEGYVTVRHNMESLSEICGEDGHVIAVYNNEVVGYALTMHSMYAEKIPELIELMEQLRSIEDNQEFLIMGQLCVAKEWRGKGVVKNMYAHMKDCFVDRYPGIYTEVASDNLRSLKAHIKCGYQVIHTYDNRAGKEWKIVYCDWME